MCTDSKECLQDIGSGKGVKQTEWFQYEYCCLAGYRRKIKLCVQAYGTIYKTRT